MFICTQCYTPWPLLSFHLEPGITYSLGGCNACMGIIHVQFSAIQYFVAKTSCSMMSCAFQVDRGNRGIATAQASQAGIEVRPWPDQYFHLMWVCLNVSECLVGVVRMFNIAYGYSCIVWPLFSCPTITDSILHSPHQSAPH